MGISQGFKAYDEPCGLHWHDMRRKFLYLPKKEFFCCIWQRRGLETNFTQSAHCWKPPTVLMKFNGDESYSDASTAGWPRQNSNYDTSHFQNSNNFYLSWNAFFIMETMYAYHYQMQKWMCMLTKLKRKFCCTTNFSRYLVLPKHDLHFVPAGALLTACVTWQLNCEMQVNEWSWLHLAKSGLLALDK